MSHVFLFFFYKVIELVGGGCVINGPTPSIFFLLVRGTNIYMFMLEIPSSNRLGVRESRIFCKKLINKP